MSNAQDHDHADDDLVADFPPSDNDTPHVTLTEAGKACSDVRKLAETFRRFNHRQCDGLRCGRIPDDKKLRQPLKITCCSCCPENVRHAAADMISVAATRARQGNGRLRAQAACPLLHLVMGHQLTGVDLCKSLQSLLICLLFR